MSTFPHTGKVTWIGIRPAPRVVMQSLPSVEAIAGCGLAGDRAAAKSRPGNARQVTLIQAEHLAVIAGLLQPDGQPDMQPDVQRDAIEASLTRRNIVVAGINLLALKGHTFRIGEAHFEMSGECHPCSLMELQLGIGGYNAMRGHGGITAKVLESGLICVGDIVTPLGPVADIE